MTAPTWAVVGTECVVEFGGAYLDGEVVRTTPTQIIVSAGSRTFRFSRADGIAYGNPRGTLHRGDEPRVVSARRNIAAKRALRDADRLTSAHLMTHRQKPEYIADPVTALRALIEQAKAALEALPPAPDAEVKP